MASVTEIHLTTLRNLPKISIITPSYNQGIFLKETLNSVITQRYPNIEYIVIDGGSTDSSVDIIKNYASHLTYWESCKDSGQVDAINKGMRMATGDIMGFLNSDDLLENNSLHRIAEVFIEHSHCDWIVGGCRLFGEYYVGSGLVMPVPPNNLSDMLNLRSRMPQPAVFWHRRLWSTVGEFNISLDRCFDNEYWVRAFIKGFRVMAIPEILAAYRMHPESKTCKNWEPFMDEFRHISKTYKEFASSAEQKEILHYWLTRDFVHNMQTALTQGKSNGRVAAVKLALEAVLRFPKGVLNRAFWGFLSRWVQADWKA